MMIRMEQYRYTPFILYANFIVYCSLDSHLHARVIHPSSIKVDTIASKRMKRMKELLKSTAFADFSYANLNITGD